MKLLNKGKRDTAWQNIVFDDSQLKLQNSCQYTLPNFFLVRDYFHQPKLQKFCFASTVVASIFGL